MNIHYKRFLFGLWAVAIVACLLFLNKVDEFFTDTQQPVANVSRLNGSAEMRRGEMVSWSPVEEGTGIADKTIVATSAKSTIEITFQDGRRIRVGENSQIYVTVETKNQELINSVTLVRGELITLKPIRQKYSDKTKKINRQLVVKEADSKEIRVVDDSSKISLQRDPDVEVTANEKLGGRPKFDNSNPQLSDGLALRGPISSGRPNEYNLKNIDPFALSLVSPTVDVPVVSVPSLKPRVPVTRPSLPLRAPLPAAPSLGLKSGSAPVLGSIDQEGDGQRVLNEIQYKTPPPKLAFADSSTFCTFDTFDVIGVDGKKSSMTIPIHWDPPDISPRPESSSYAMIITNGAVDDGDSKIVKMGVMYPGKNHVRIDLESLLAQLTEQDKSIVRRIPLRISIKIIKVEVGSTQIEVPPSSLEKKLFLCSITPTTDQAYTISLDRLIILPKYSGRWFRWDESRSSYRYSVRVESLDYLRKMHPILKSVGSFRITNDEVSPGKQVVYYIKNEKIIGSVYGEVPSKAEMILLKKTFDSDLAFLSRSGEFLPLEKAAGKRMLMIDQALRIHKKIYLFVNGRLITVTKDEVEESSGLVRSYLQSTWGVFVTPPRIL